MLSKYVGPDFVQTKYILYIYVLLLLYILYITYILPEWGPRRRAKHFIIIIFYIYNDPVV